MPTPHIPRVVRDHLRVPTPLKRHPRRDGTPSNVRELHAFLSALIDEGHGGTPIGFLDTQLGICYPTSCHLYDTEHEKLAGAALHPFTFLFQ